MIPTMEEVVKIYPTIAKIERMKTGSPSVLTVQNVLRGVKRICKAGDLKLTDRVDMLTRRRIDLAICELVSSGLKLVSVKSYRNHLQAILARWCKPYYADMGWEIPKLELPLIRLRPTHYLRPSAEKLEKVKNWYKKLEGEWWFAATMMLEFAMRNGDIMRLQDNNFIEQKDITPSGKGRKGHYLSYQPHKTALSSGRCVCWRIADSIWKKFCDYGGLSGLDVTDETFKDINRDLRALGFTGSKASYELRKICIDHIYQRFGAEVAVAISGDDIRTISRYYADTARPNAEMQMCVIDMF